MKKATQSKCSKNRRECDALEKSLKLIIGYRDVLDLADSDCYLSGLIRQARTVLKERHEK